MTLATTMTPEILIANLNRLSTSIIGKTESTTFRSVIMKPEAAATHIHNAGRLCKRASPV